MARKASRGTAKKGPEKLPSPSSHRKKRSEEARGRPFSLLKSSDLRSMGNEGVAKTASNKGTLSDAGGTGTEAEYNDFIECLGYPPPRTVKGVERRGGESEEYNDFIECLGYPPPRAWEAGQGLRNHTNKKKK